jgi:hypothetical protein
MLAEQNKLLSSNNEILDELVKVNNLKNGTLVGYKIQEFDNDSLLLHPIVELSEISDNVINHTQSLIFKNNKLNILNTIKWIPGGHSGRYVTKYRPDYSKVLQKLSELRSSMGNMIPLSFTLLSNIDKKYDLGFNYKAAFDLLDSQFRSSLDFHSKYDAPCSNQLHEKAWSALDVTTRSNAQNDLNNITNRIKNEFGIEIGNPLRWKGGEFEKWEFGIQVGYSGNNWGITIGAYIEYKEYVPAPGEH